MNTREIASAVNKDERSVRRWINKASDKMSGLSDKMSGAEKTKIPADYDLEETCFIIEQGLGKNASEMFRANANFNKTPLPESTLTQRDLDLISALTISIISGLNQRLTNLESKIEEKQILLPAPEIKTRDGISKIVKEYAYKTDTPYSVIWSRLYTEFNYRHNCNVNTSAKNRNMTVIDYIDTEGMIDQLYAVASILYEVK